MTQEIDSESSARVTWPGGRLTNEEIRARAQATYEERLSRLKRQAKSKLTIDLVLGIPAAYRPRAVKVLVGDGRMSERIKFNCEQCVGWEDVKHNVGGCRSYACAFWEVRPYQGGEG